MAEKSIIQLIKDFDIQQLKGVSLIYGTEEFLKKQLIERVKGCCNPTILWGDEIQLSDLKEKFGSGSLFSTETTVILLNGEEFIKNLSKKDVGDFLKLLQGIQPPDRLLIFLSLEKPPAKEPYKTLLKEADSIVSPNLTPKAFYISIKNKIQKAGKKIDDETLKYLLSKIKNDLFVAKQEIEKLLLYVGDREEITKEDIDKVIIPSKVDNIFAFLDRFFSKDKRALEILNQLIETQYHPFEIQTLLLNHINKILMFKSLLKSGKDLEGAFASVGVKHPSAKATLKKHSSLTSEKELISLIKQLYQLEIDQKVNYQDINKSLQEFVLKVVHGG
ncbi:MAG: DNA polymerase III subunit delta [Aquificae bacterium]|nr:DNA polymerase III subunit delta [Aquificota bacterium]